MAFKVISAKEIKGNFFEMFDDQWALLTGGDAEGFNPMTISYGNVGIMWGKPIVSVMIRDHRYTYRFMEDKDYFTVSFYPEEYREQLNLCGVESGRDIDKVKATGFTPAFASCGAAYFEEAELVLVCRKAYHYDVVPENFHINEPGNVYAEHYENHDYHRIYIAEIVEVLEKTK